MSTRRETIAAITEKYIADIREHADAVQVMISYERDEPDNHNTAYEFAGSGNVHARYGVAKDWVLMQEEFVRIEARKRDEESNE